MRFICMHPSSTGYVPLSADSRIFTTDQDGIPCFQTFKQRRIHSYRMEKDSTYGIDKIDREILQILMQDPRMPYAEIAERLEDAGHEMSAEGVRHRVKKLFDESTIFLLTGPQGNEWEVVRLDVSVKNESGARSDVFKRMGDDDFWLVCRGFGTIDIHAVATVANVEEADKLVNRIRSIDKVEAVDYFLETERMTDMHKYAIY